MRFMKNKKINFTNNSLTFQIRSNRGYLPNKKIKDIDFI